MKKKKNETRIKQKSELQSEITERKNGKNTDETAEISVEQQVVALLKNQNYIMTAVESCTGGMIAAAITSVPGSSSVFHQGYVTYCDRAKHQMAGVRKKTLRKYTAVSRQTAKEMALGGARAAKADCCISVTGYAGPPSGASEEEVGLVYIGCAVCGKVKVKEYHFSGERNEVRQKAKEEALKMLALRLLKKQG